MSEPGAKLLKTFDESPDAGDPHCVCSYCDCRIDEDETPYRCWSEGKEIRLHERCLGECIELGIMEVT